MRAWVVGGLGVVAACGGTHRVVISRPMAATRQVVAEPLPAPRAPDSGRAGELVRNSIVGPLQSLFNSPGVARRLVGHRAESYNVTSADDVADDGWFVSRVADRS